MRTSLGCGIAGIVDLTHSQLVSVANDKPFHLAFRIHVTVTEISPLTVCNMFDLDFNERKSEERISVEDRHFLDKLSNEIHRRAVILKRLSCLKSKFLRDSQYRDDYSRFMA